MLLTTPEELRLYLPTHVVESLEPLAGFIDNSEHDFLLEKTGAPLYGKLAEKYDEITDKRSLLPGGNAQEPWYALICLCQRPVAFDMLLRAADVSAVSVNAGGLNIPETDGYDAAGENVVERYKKRLNTEAHRAVDRLLTTLEEWAEETGPGTDGEEENQETADKREIVELWRKSRYYYLADGLFINTARKFNEFVDIYESREKFIQLLPDLRYCQEFVIRPELGDSLTDALVERMRDGLLTATERKAVRLIQYTLALKTEARSPLFKREKAEDEAIGAMRRMLDFMAAHQEDLPEEAVKDAPFYKEPEIPDKDNPSLQPPSAPAWENNRKGNRIFITPSVE